MGGSLVHSPDLLPDWLGILAAVIFLLVAGSHLGHLVISHGGRRFWHSLHVVMALGMAAMYVPAAVDPFSFGAEVWRLAFVLAGAVAILRWSLGASGVWPGSPLWLLTAIDFAVMDYMWSADLTTAALSWLLTGYLVIGATLWLVNAYRALEDERPSVGRVGIASDGGALVILGGRRETLIGGLDISVSMTVMAAGMAYMLAAMQLMS